jgi:hypothetical protein
MDILYLSILGEDIMSWCLILQVVVWMLSVVPLLVYHRSFLVLHHSTLNDQWSLLELHVIFMCIGCVYLAKLCVWSLFCRDSLVVWYVVWYRLPLIVADLADWNYRQLTLLGLVVQRVLQCWWESLVVFSCKRKKRINDSVSYERVCFFLIKESPNNAVMHYRGCSLVFCDITILTSFLTFLW